MKAIAIYRDNCKVAQPLSSSGTRQQAVATPPVHVHERKPCPLDRTEVGRGKDARIATVAPLDGRVAPAYAHVPLVVILGAN